MLVSKYLGIYLEEIMLGCEYFSKIYKKKKKLSWCEYFGIDVFKNLYCLELYNTYFYEKIQSNIYKISYSIFEKYNIIYNILY